MIATLVVLLAALVVAVVVIMVLLTRHASFRASHKYTDGDLASARQDSLTRSRHVVSGKVQEHLAPLFPEFLSQFNPRDARFLGTPLDFVVFDGLDEGEECRNIVFVEVKTGRSSVTKRERHVRDAISRAPSHCGEPASPQPRARTPLPCTRSPACRGTAAHWHARPRESLFVCGCKHLLTGTRHGTRWRPVRAPRGRGRLLTPSGS
jgi:Endonuclease related to archaeal Holliday junction resolvase